MLLGSVYNQVNAQTLNENSNNDNLYTYYTVKVGDTAYSISKAFNITKEELYKNNAGTEDGIKIGQVLALPKPNTNAKDSQAKISPLNDSSSSRTMQESSPTKIHKIQPKETLYSVAKGYNINVTDLINANKDLSEENFQIGRDINIPVTKAVADSADFYTITSRTGLQHVVKKGETLYGIGKEYGIGLDDLKQKNPFLNNGLKDGSVIVIPYLDSSSDKNYQRTSPGKYPSYFKKNDNVLRIGVLLPFNKGTKAMSKEKIAEYYEGFLLAVEDLKKEGLNAEIYTFDIDDENNMDRLDNILRTTEINTVDMIIGGVSDAQIRFISNFSKRTGIKYVIPFTNRTTGVDFNPNMYQVINSHSNLYRDVASVFIEKYAGYNVVFYNEPTATNDKLDFVKILQEQLTRNKVNYTTLSGGASITDDIKEVTFTSKPTVVVPTSSSDVSLKRLADAAYYLNQNNYQITLFGYPEWQTYNKYRSELHQTGATFYSIFYLSDTPSLSAFESQFKYWYNKQVSSNSLPKYAPMGYDTGKFFISALSEFGDKMGDKINEVKYIPLEIPFFFDKQGASGGYINNGMFFVNYKLDGEIKRLEIR